MADDDQKRSRQQNPPKHLVPKDDTNEQPPKVPQTEQPPNDASRPVQEQLSSPPQQNGDKAQISHELRVPRLCANADGEKKSLVHRRLMDLWLDLKFKEFIPIKILNFLLFGGMMALFPFLTIQARSLGITESELGIVYGFLPVTALFGPPLAGMLADKIGNFKYFLAVMVAASGVTSLLYIPIPVGRMEHPMPPVLPLSLSCSSPSSARVEFLDGMKCTFNPADVPLSILITSCQQHCSTFGDASSGDNGSDSPKPQTNTLLPNDSYIGELNTTESLRDYIDSLSPPSQFNPARVDQLLKPRIVFLDAEEGVLVFEDGLCGSLNSNVSTWTSSRSAVSPSHGTPSSTDAPSHCHAECRLLVESAVLCTNTLYTENINPSLTFWTYVLVRILNSLTLATSMPLFEGAVVSVVKQYDGDLGFQRMYGSLGPLVMTPLSGMLIDKFSSISGTQDFRPAFYVYFVIKFMCAAVILRLDLEFKKPSETVVKDFKAIITTPEISMFLLMTFVAGACFGAMDTFLFWLLQDMGASKSLMGLTLTVGNVCSLPILLFASPIINKLGSVNTIILGFSFYVVRFIGYSLIYNPWWCMPFEALECFTVALLITAAITYAAELSTTSTTATLQGLMGGLHHGVGRGAGSLLGGFLMAGIGVRSTFQLMAGVAFVTAAIYFVINRIFFRKAAQARKIKRKLLEVQKELQMNENSRVVEGKMTIENKDDEDKGPREIRHLEGDNPAFEEDDADTMPKTDRKRNAEINHKEE